ncbi:hypothetical protein N7G274_005360 [Stereocaulon virgatum]|uniref:Uncharacterized protein n=1 Tax=Stereocaulon virgatum TaxID=373712 RepID=A0ABR4A8H5_9LECA
MRETKTPHMKEFEGHSPIEKEREVSLIEAFCDSLFKVHLTRHALKELDRRNSRERRRSPANNTIAVDLELRRSGINSAHLRIFARNGGPELHDIRGYRKPRIEQAIETMNLPSHCASDKETSRNTKSSLNSSAHGVKFKEKHYDNVIYEWSYTYSSECPRLKAGNLEELKNIVFGPLRFASGIPIDEQAHIRFCQRDSGSIHRIALDKGCIPLHCRRAPHP